MVQTDGWLAEMKTEHEMQVPGPTRAWQEKVPKFGTNDEKGKSCVELHLFCFARYSLQVPQQTVGHICVHDEPLSRE